MADEESHIEPKLGYGDLEEAERKELEELLVTFTNVINTTTSRVSILKHIINTSDSSCPGWQQVGRTSYRWK